MVTEFDDKTCVCVILRDKNVTEIIYLDKIALALKFGTVNYFKSEGANKTRVMRARTRI